MKIVQWLIQWQNRLKSYPLGLKIELLAANIRATKMITILNYKVADMDLLIKCALEFKLILQRFRKQGEN